MSDSATPTPAQAPSIHAPTNTNANANTNEKKPNGGNRNNSNNGRPKRGTGRQASVSNGPKDNVNGPGANTGANANSGAKSQPRPQQRKPSTNTGASSPAPAPQATPAVASDGSRPPSTDGNKKNDNRRNNNNNNNGPRRDSQSAGRGQGNNRRGSNRQASQSRQQSGDQARTSPSTENPAPAASNDAQRLLERAITDMKTSAQQQQSSAVAPQQQPTPQGSTLGLNAPVFQPGASVYPTPGAPTDLPPRHRKSASTGSHSSPGSFNSPSFASPLQGFSPHLHSMREDVAEEGEIDEEAQFQRRNPQPPVGTFAAPRFAALAQQQQQPQPTQEESEVLGPTGRPQLAPSFQFGVRRRTNTNPTNGPAIPEDDLGFQFPQQQHYQPEAQAHQQQSQPVAPVQPQAHRRAGSEVSGMLAEQMALQAQIEALQQQQQHLLQQQIATGGVMSTFAGAANLGPGRPMQNHRRIQSQQIPVGGGMGNFGSLPGAPLGNFGNVNLNGGLGLGMPHEQNPNARGHGRRHSVNVINKSPAGGETLGQFNYPYEQEGYGDGFAPPPTGHNRQASRSDASWRINGGAGAIGNNFAQGTAELAQAQAQLQSLQQFRAAAGGHHQKMASFSFPNMLPNMMAANMMSFGGGLNVLQQQQQQFQMQLQQQSNQPQRKSLFAPYLPQASLPPLLAAGKLVVGILRVNKRNRSDAYVSTEVLDADIYICGSKDRNRALEGDIVAVELLDVDEVWGTKKEKEEKKRKKEENAAYDVRGAAGRKNDKKKDDVEVEGQGLMLFEDEEVTDEVKPQFAGHVVAVVERMPGQLFSGTLGLLRPSSAATKEKQEAERREREGERYDEQAAKKDMERPKIVWFKPTDKRVPLIAIPTEQAPPDFVTNSEAYADRLFVACIKRHPISSLHPFGTLVEELGPIGDVEVETSALLKDCNFPTEEFTDNVTKCLPPLPWTIPEREYETRRDFRSERVFTIDPATAKDMDDALHVQVNDDGTYDVGIHITDVSYFVKPNTALDRDARKRATSVYLVQRAVPMLPPTLSEELCSLVPGKERLTFSAVFTMTEDARVIKKWFGRAIIKSAAKLSYGEVQAVIDGGNLVSENLDPQHSANAIEGDLKILQTLAKQMRERRTDNGTLSVQSLKLKFDLDESGAPVDCSDEAQTEANYLVAEFMILANTAVAQQIAVHLPEQALLRRHEEPIERRLLGFKERAARLGHDIDVSSAGALQKSFNSIQDPIARRILEILCSKAMHRAKYFCTGMLDIAKYSHYALAEPLYTHFTSPIRRYADIIVHRQLESVLSPTSDVKFTMDRDSVAKVAQQCNIKKGSAKLAQEQSAHLFLCLLISDLTQKYGPVVRQARVVGVLDAAFDVLIPEFGIEKRVHVDQMPIDNHVFEEHSHTLQIYWSTRDVISWLAENSDDEHLKKVKQTAEQHAVKMELTSRSVHDERALFDEDEEDEIVISRPALPSDAAEETSKQRKLSKAKVEPQFEGLRRTSAGHRIQDIRELMSVPVIVTADLTKSPPVIKVYSVNPYAEAVPTPAKK
ncbi:putative cell wall biogenesis protein phosphatase SSD1 [Rhizoctonia solani 123E]|uniref:DIS3-like exonuclease 2 n=1 Tax=Rhizoctonia solani 123E TaxID=1423351 RepID=A0A074SWT4_9AGAM|nr:putative cell wall biogenesis protein phosphatase SSD1 [Rhizoctonia solani 123E]